RKKGPCGPLGEPKLLLFDIRLDAGTAVDAFVPAAGILRLDRIGLIALGVGGAAGQDHERGNSEKRFHVRYFLYVTPKALQTAATGGLPNCCRKALWLSKNSRRSVIPYLSIANLSTPAPKAKPGYFSTSRPPTASTLRWVMPQPRTSSQPVFL